MAGKIWVQFVGCRIKLLTSRKSMSFEHSTAQNRCGCDIARGYFGTGEQQVRIVKMTLS
jgi:hypothetical protein